MHLALTGEGLGLLIAMLAVAGLVAGFLSGLLGIGGGGVLVPVIYEALGVAGVPEDIRMHLALGTSLAVIAPTGLRSFAAHYARGSVDMDVVKRMAPWIFFGVTLGILIAGRSSSAELRWVWVIFGTVLAIKMAIGRDDWRIGDTLPKPPVLEAISFIIGILSTLMGIGGALFSVPLQTLYGRPLLRSVATASAFGPVIALTGLIGYMLAGWSARGLPPYSLGFVSAGALLIAPLSVLAAPLGVHMAHNITKRKLEIAFAMFIVCVVVRFVVTLI